MLQQSLQSVGPTPQLPHNISQKQSELQEITNLIASLRSQLLAAERRRSNIQNELESYAARHTGIQNLPHELLCVIFSLLDGDQRTRNCILSFVCKTWHVVVEGTPQLWTQIVVKWEGDLNGVVSSWRYLKKCHDRSQKSLFDLVVDFGKLPTYDAHLCSAGESAKVDLHSYYFKPHYYYSGGLQMLEGHRSQYNALVDNTMRLLYDKGKYTCSRLRSLCLVTPSHFSEQQTKDILNTISGCEENLTDLHYDGTRQHYDEGSKPLGLAGPMRSLKVG